MKVNGKDDIPYIVNNKKRFETSNQNPYKSHVFWVQSLNFAGSPTAQPWKRLPASLRPDSAGAKAPEEAPVAAAVAASMQRLRRGRGGNLQSRCQTNHAHVGFGTWKLKSQRNEFGTWTFGGTPNNLMVEHHFSRDSCNSGVIDSATGSKGRMPWDNDLRSISIKHIYALHMWDS